MTPIMNNPFNKVRIIDVYGSLYRLTGLTHIGTLSKITEDYHFSYGPEQTDMLPRKLPGLIQMHNQTGDLSKWPFFYKRLPKLSNPEVQRVIETEGIDATKPIVLLATLGARSTTDTCIFVARLK